MERTRKVRSSCEILIILFAVQADHVPLQMQRIHTMNIVPDLLADFHPSIDLSISCGVGNDVEVGTFVDAKKVSQ